MQFYLFKKKPGWFEMKNCIFQLFFQVFQFPLYMILFFVIFYAIFRVVVCRFQKHININVKKKKNYINRLPPANW